jgi:hypothetical protein
MVELVPSSSAWPLLIASLRARYRQTYQRLAPLQVS